DDDHGGGGGCGHCHDHSHEPSAPTDWAFWADLGPTVICGLCLAIGWGLDLTSASAATRTTADLIYGFGAIVAAIPTGWHTLQSLARGRLDVDLLMLIGALGATLVGHVDEATVLLFLFTLSHTLEAFALGRTRSALQALLALRPDEAVVLRNGEPVKTPLDEVAVGETIVVRPGERVPLDGLIRKGEADFDESALTGEALPRFKSPGDAVLAGGINLSGALEIEVVRPAGQSTLARMVELVETARSGRAPTQRLLDRFLLTYVIAILIGATATAVVPAALGLATWYEMFYRSMTLLVVASPCALAISTPATILSAIAAAAQQGVLFKGGAAVEALGAADLLAFDKTGTLTEGKLTVGAIYPQPGVSSSELLKYVAAAEASSEHPLAQAIVREAAGQGIAVPPADSFHTSAGLGVEAQVAGRTVLVGGRRFLESRDVSFAGNAATEENEPASGATSANGPGAPGNVVGKNVWGAIDGRLAGRVVLHDRIRPESAAAVRRLTELGVKNVVMLTGDEAHAAQAIAQQAGVTEFKAELLPDAKATYLAEQTAAGRRTVMVGDGVNDAPALAAANVGVAMGAAGTDIAIEAADVVLMSSRLDRLVDAVALSRAARSILWQNLGFAISVVIVLVSLTLLGRLSMSWGVVGHEGSTVLVVLNGLRLLARNGWTTAPRAPA
ncbi:MAG TPA: cation-translocating P-type ATPase, partial [Pirellulales bacterium]